MTAPKGAGPESAATDPGAQKNAGSGRFRSSKLQPQDPQAAPKSWRDVLPIHPAADLFPRMSADEVRALSEEIKKNGPKSPIVLWSPGYNGDGVKDRPRFVLDGINMLDAMELVGIQFLTNQGAPTALYGPRFRTEYGKQQLHYMTRGCRRSGAISGPRGELKTEPYSCVISANIHRQLTAEQKRELIAKLIKGAPEKSDRQIAERVKASPITVGTVPAAEEIGVSYKTLRDAIEMNQVQAIKSAASPACRKPRSRVSKRSLHNRKRPRLGQPGRST